MKIKNLIIGALIIFVIYKYTLYKKSPAAAANAAVGKSDAAGFLYNLAGISFPADVSDLTGADPNTWGNTNIKPLGPPTKEDPTPTPTKPPIYDSGANLVQASGSSDKSGFSTTYKKTPFVRL